MKPDSKGKKPASRGSKTMRSLGARKISAKEANQVKGGRRHDDESPKEAR